MAPKRGHDGGEPTSLTKRNKIALPSPVPFNEEHEVQDTNHMRSSMQLDPQQTPAPTMDLYEFDEEAESRKADAMRLRMQGGRRRSPIPDFNQQGGGFPNIKLEDEEISFIGSPAGPANTNNQPDEIFGTGDLDLDHDDDSVLMSDLNIAAQIKAAAVILRQEDPSHRQFQSATQLLEEVISPRHNVQVGAVVSKLVKNGVHPDRADEVAEALQQQAPRPISLVEAAEGLTSIHGLEKLLGFLRKSAPDEGVGSQLYSWRKDIRRQRKFDQQAQSNHQGSRSVTPDRDLGALISVEHRSGSVLMSGGLGAFADTGEEENAQVSEQNTETTKKLASGENSLGDCIHDRRDTNEQSAKDVEERVKIFETEYPRRIDLFMFHVFEARSAIAALQVLERDEFSRIAKICYEAMDEAQRYEWTILHGKLLTGDRGSLDGPTGTEILDRQGHLERFQQANRCAVLATATASVTRDVRMGTLSAPAQSVRGSSSQNQEADVTKPNHGGLPELREPTLVWYSVRPYTVQRVAFVVNVPGQLICHADRGAFQAACATSFGGKADLETCEQPSEHLWHVQFHQLTDAESVVRRQVQISLGGVKLYPESLPNSMLKWFQCNLIGLRIPEEEVVRHISNALKDPKSSKGESLTSNPPRLYKYPNDQYFIWIPFSRKQHRQDQLLRFFLPLRGSGIVHNTQWTPVATITMSNCPYCPKAHALPCRKARLIELPSLNDDAFPDQEQKPLRLQFPDRRSVFLHHVFKACEAAGFDMLRSDCDERSLELWNNLEHDNKQPWSRLRSALLKGDLSALDPSAAEALLNNLGIPGAMSLVAGDGEADFSNDDSMASHAEEDEPWSGIGSDSEEETEIAKSVNADDGEEADSSSSEDPGDSDEELQSTQLDTSPGNEDPSEQHEVIPTPAAGMPHYSFKSHGDELHPWHNLVSFRQFYQKNPSSKLVFIIDTEDCPITEMPKEGLRERFTAQLGQTFQSIDGPYKTHTFTVQFHSEQLAMDALRNNASILVGKDRVYAESVPKTLTTLLYCDLCGQNVPEKALRLAVREAFSHNSRREPTLLRYPGGKYVIRLSQAAEILRAYVKLTWPDGRLCIVRFRRMEDSRKRKCEICRKSHKGACPNAVALTTPRLVEKKRRRKGGRRDWQNQGQNFARYKENGERKRN